ncbi:hypothetical protein Nepgr_011471 [Nepenthes gracilis]|uniref:Uncharacterized protein n=1 Tax=Nepenthes gracilis TaxID=150966 RepID=A0AAD3XMC9_NEPGR|nr:hypothetical protein Nepgr_011471 [Nepenthes gracilis]
MSKVKMLALFPEFLAMLARAIITLHMDICWRFIIWMISIISFPARALGALHRAKMMEGLLQEMQNELENLVWERKELEAQLQMAVKEHHLLDAMLAELEEEHDKAIVEIQFLESEVLKLKAENVQLRETQRKRLCEIGYGQTTDTPNMHDDMPYGISSLKRNMGSATLFEDLLMHKNAWVLRTGNKMQSKSIRLEDPLAPLILSSNLDSNEVMNQRREVAFYQSLFSMLLSIIVGMITWEAEDPCTPLIVALFTVVGMSMMSVLQFFSTIRNKAASDAVALLSFSWFLLGTLTYPILPRVHILCSLVLRFLY